jgi:hypothetical protein
MFQTSVSAPSAERSYEPDLLQRQAQGDGNTLPIREARHKVLGTRLPPAWLLMVSERIMSDSTTYFWITWLSIFVITVLIVFWGER